MIKLLKKSKLFILALILINTTSLIASEIPHQTIIKSESYFANKGDIINQLYNEDGLLMYDAIIQLIDEIEDGTIDDICTNEDWYKINHFLTFLAKQGILPNATEEEKAELEKDIDEILNPYDNRISFENASYIDGVKIIPAICYGQPEFVLCKSWFKKQCKHIGKFVKKHKTAVIVGTVVVVAAVAVVATVAIASSAAAASAATVSAAETCAPETKNKEVQKTEPSQSTTTAYDPVLHQSFDNQVNEYKNTIVQNDFSSSLGQSFLNKENERIIGSSLAHTAIDNIPSYMPYDNNNPIIIQGHGKTDNVFSTNQSPLYFDSNTSKSPNSIQENVFYLQGAQALRNNYYDQAIDSFGKAIEINPSNHNIYLDRAYAHLQNGQLDQSLNDYNKYQENEQKNLLSKGVDFIKDSAIFYYNTRVAIEKGIAKGVVDSGKQLLSIAANAIEHPINTSIAIYKVIDSIDTFQKNCIFHPIDSYKQIYTTITDSQTWIGLRDAVIPELRNLMEDWGNLSLDDKIERISYLISKTGTDIFLPGAATKAATKGLKEVKTLIQIAKNLEKTEQVLVLEGLAEAGGRTEEFTQVLYKTRTAEQFLPRTSELLNSIKRISSFTNKDAFLNEITRISKLGKRGSNDLIRLFQGGKEEGLKVFNELTKKGTIICKDSEKIISKLSDEIHITYRSLSKSGPPTIDINVEGLERNIKYKFIEGK